MAVAPPQSVERRRLMVRGVVQGVGFRPFVYGLAWAHGLDGFVLNDGSGVVIEAQGAAAALDDFRQALSEEAPALARVDSVATSLMKVRSERGFAIRTSEGAGAGAHIPPDIATCEDCLGELFDPADRRYRYPFINCTQCGPRFTIVREVPYDRANTTMASFAMCEECRREYEDPSDRRFHAEPIACPACGPRLSMPVQEGVGLLRGGHILAVKGLGGYHLACDATNEDAVAALRARKHREEKPFAVMAADPWASIKRCRWAARPVPRNADPRSLVELSTEEEALLRAPDRPIVLARRRPDAPVAESVAPGNPWLGLMLP
jgi:hydrogenase maturation protein HypF